MSSEVAIGLEVTQHRPKVGFTLLSQVIEVCEVNSLFLPAGTIQDVERGLVLVPVKREVEARRVMIQVNSAARPCQPVCETLFNQVWRDV